MTHVEERTRSCLEVNSITADALRSKPVHTVSRTLGGGSECLDGATLATEFTNDVVTAGEQAKRHDRDSCLS